MTSDELQNHLSVTWYREQSADDAHDVIWGEPFDGETVRISDIAKIIDRELTEAWLLLNVLCLNMMDDGPTWPRVLEWLRRNEEFSPENVPSVP